MPLVSELQGVILMRACLWAQTYDLPQESAPPPPRCGRETGVLRSPLAPSHKMAESRSSLSRVSCAHTQGAQLSTCRFT